MIYLFYLQINKFKYKDTPVYELTNVQVQYGTANIPTATVSAVNTEW